MTSAGTRIDRGFYSYKRGLPRNWDAWIRKCGAPRRPRNTTKLLDGVSWQCPACCCSTQLAYRWGSWLPTSIRPYSASTRRSPYPCLSPWGSSRNLRIWSQCPQNRRPANSADLDGCAGGEGRSIPANGGWFCGPWWGNHFKEQHQKPISQFCPSHQDCPPRPPRRTAQTLANRTVCWSSSEIAFPHRGRLHPTS